MARSPRAFTLLELLVSIGIIAVLIGVLLPVLRSSRESAQRVVCLSNLRTFGYALQMYKDDHEGILPYSSRQYDVSIGWTDPIDALMPYLGDIEPPGKVLGLRAQPYVCPLDQSYADLTGLSYGYVPANFMSTFVAETPQQRRRVAKWVTEIVYDTPPRRKRLLTDRFEWHNPRQSLFFDGSVGLDDSTGGF